MSGHQTRRAARALAAAGQRRAQADPLVRGADWRTATVDTVGTDGTITTSDGIPCRRIQTYQAPAVGDQVVITRSGSGNWLAAGRLAAAGDGWTALTLASGWTANASYNTPAYRLHGDGTASLCGLASNAGVTGVATVATLPFTLPAKVRFVTEVATNTFGVLDILASGAVQIGDYSGTAKWAALDGARFRIA